MGKVSENDTTVVLGKLAVLIPSFYGIYFVSSIALSALFSLECNEDECKYYKLPFCQKLSEFRPEGNELALAAWLSMVVTFVLSTALMYFLVASTSKSWDYACTLAFVHFIVTCITNSSFPMNWVWWITIILCTFILSSLGEISNYYRDMQEIVVDLE